MRCRCISLLAQNRCPHYRAYECCIEDDMKEKLNTMELVLQRFAEALDYTYGFLGEKGSRYPMAFVLEDEGRTTKVRGETRIPAGRYQIKFRKVLSGMTKKYRSRFSWFTWHLELQDVPGFKYVYIHIGNTDEHTDGCLLVANTCDLDPQNGNGFIGDSTSCFKDIYQHVSKALKDGKQVFIEVKDIT